MMGDDILTIRDVAAYLKVTEKTVYGLAQQGLIPAFKVGGQWRFRRDDIDDWIAGQTKGGAHAVASSAASVRRWGRGSAQKAKGAR